MSRNLGQPFVVDNQARRRRQHRNGCSRQGHARRLYPGSSVPPARWPPNKTLFKALPYEPEKDFTPVSLFAVMPNVVVVEFEIAAEDAR